MKDASLLGVWIRRFLLEHMVAERNLAHNTQSSYRDALVVFLPFAAKQIGKTVDQLAIEDVSADIIRRFLLHLEQQRGCSVSTRNQRLAAIHALARFIGERNPERIAWLTEIKSVPFKKTSKPSIAYLDKDEINAVLNAPKRDTQQGMRDHALLLFLYNSGARASEAAQLTIADLILGSNPSVTLLGKGGKVRQCPLWPQTVSILSPLIDGRGFNEFVFLNHR
ncbi:MAG: tyrosine-type recombinase/integrase, partial [Syntrophales bacterium]|nr:tyrosine-type recombinase/integrase [Syntrophales bacterium]